MQMTQLELTSVAKQRHEHESWTFVASPVVVGAIKSDVGDDPDATTEYGASLIASRRMSRSVMLDLGFLIARTRDGEELTYSYLITLVPKLIVANAQRDRFFVGLGAAILALDESSAETRWGYGPQATLGVDLNLSRATCLCIAGEFGITGFGVKRVQATPDPEHPLPEGHGDSDRSAAWARIVLGVRLSL